MPLPTRQQQLGLVILLAIIGVLAFFRM